MLTLYPSDLPNNVHDVSPTNPARVTRSRFYRMSWAGVIEHSDPRFRDLAGVFPEAYRPTGTFGTAGLESQEHSILWIGSPDVVVRFRDDPAQAVPWAEINQTGSRVDRWPNSDAWLDLIPATTWNPGGQGIVTEHDFDGAKVIVYETLSKPTLLSESAKGAPQGPVPVVTFHCARCHEAADAVYRHTSCGPEDRRVAGLEARRHMRPGRCRGADAVARGDEMVAVVESVARGVPAPGDTAGLYASRCQTGELQPGGYGPSTCAEVREARKHTARHGTAR